MFRKSRFHLTVVYSAIIGLTLVMVAAVCYFFLAHTMDERAAVSLRNTTSTALENLSAKMDMESVRLVSFSNPSHSYVTLNFLASDEFALLSRTNLPPLHLSPWTTVEPGGVNWWLNEDIASWKAQNSNPENRSPLQFFHTTLAGKTYLTSITRVDDMSNGYEFLYLGKNTTDNTRVLRQMRMILISLCSGLLLLATLLGHWFAGKAMVPIREAYHKLRDFTADASHELRTPITILNSAVEIVQEHQDRLPELHQDMLLSAKEEIGRMTLMVDNLLTLARSDSGDVELLCEPVDLIRIVRQAVVALSPAAVSKGITVQTNMDDNAEEIVILGDQDRLKQLVFILLDNAIKYNIPGGTVMLSVEKNRTEVHLKVQDHGIGIDEADLPRIFDRFYRTDKNRSRELGGTGLGLAIASSIVKTHRGRMAVTSKIGQGSEFTVRFPADA